MNASDKAVPQEAFPPQEIRQWDRSAIEDYGIPGVVLMENAGAGAARVILEQYSETLPPPYHIYCGPGNNGGDGFVVARHLHNHGQPVYITVIVTPGRKDKPLYRPASDAAINFDIVRRMGLPIQTIEASPLSRERLQGTIVDALFGTGLSRSIGPPFSDWLEFLGASSCPVVALDTPSGLEARSGEVLGTCLCASLTITFAARKTGFGLRSGPQVCGMIEVVNIGMPRDIWLGS